MVAYRRRSGARSSAFCREVTFTTPSLVLNYGLFKNWEAVGEFRVEASPDFEITDPGLFLKAVLKEELLQGKPGVSVAIEAGPLLPSTLPGEHGVGFEVIGIGCLRSRSTPTPAGASTGRTRVRSGSGA